MSQKQKSLIQTKLKANVPDQEPGCQSSDSSFVSIFEYRQLVYQKLREIVHRNVLEP